MMIFCSFLVLLIKRVITLLKKTKQNRKKNTTRTSEHQRKNFPFDILFYERKITGQSELCGELNPEKWSRDVETARVSSGVKSFCRRCRPDACWEHVLHVQKPSQKMRRKKNMSYVLQKI